MTFDEIKELEKKAYALGSSEFPIDVFFNDIRDNNNPRFNKDYAYQDFKKVIDFIYILADKAKKYNQLNKIYHYFETMESSDLTAEKLKDLYEFLLLNTESNFIVFKK